MTLHVWDRAAAEQSDAGAVATDGLDASGGPAAAATTLGRGLRPNRTRRRVLWVLAVLVAAALLALAVAVAVNRAAHRGVPLDPDNAGPEGARAVARVLSGHGVPVRVARGQDELVAEEIGPATTVVVTHPEELTPSTAGVLLDAAAGARRLVLVEPSRRLLEGLGLPVETAGQPSPQQVVRARCRVDGLAPDDALAPDGTTYAADDSGSTSTACFRFGDGALVVDVPADGRHPEVVVLGAGAILRNDSVTRYDHAGVAVRLLGQGDALTWYVPSLLDVQGQVDDGESVFPPATWPLVFLALWALLVLVLWRGRRFGPLVSEPLPAVVKAIETTQSRGRLYRRAGDTGRAGAALRSRTTRRLAGRLGLPPTAAPPAVSAAVADATGLDPQHVSALLAGPPPSTEADLVALAQDLSQLEKDVRRA